MKTCIVLQPNGLFARFSSVVDTFTHVNLTINEVVLVCVERLEREGTETQQANGVVLRRIQSAVLHPNRWRDGLDTVRMIHGKKRARQIKRDMTTGKVSA